MIGTEKSSKKICGLPLAAWICLWLILATLVIYWQVIHFNFVNYDDDVYVTRNPYVQAGLTLQSIKWAFTTSHAEFWHPITWLSHMLDVQLFGLHPGGHHFSSLLLHTANALLLFLIFANMTGNVGCSAVMAALFALHPLHVESVAWVAERKDVLSTFFWLLTMGAYVVFVRHPKWTAYLAALVFFILGMMAKPMLVTLPFVLLLMDFWPLERLQWNAAESDMKRGGARPTLNLIVEKLPFFAISGVFTLVTLITQPIKAYGGAFAQPLDERILNALISYATYLFKTLWPQQLAVFYPFPEKVSAFQAMGALILLLVITWGVLKVSRRHSYLLVGWLWYLGTLLPVSGVLQVGAHAMADRYTYIPLIGVFIMLVWGIAKLLTGWRYRRIVLGTAVAALMGMFMMISWIQIGYWRDGTRLFENALAVTTNNYLAANNLGNIYFRKGRLDEAIDHYRLAIRFEPRYAIAHSNLGAALVRKGRLQDAVAQFNTALRIDPTLTYARKNLGNVLAAISGKDPGDSK